MSRVLKTGTNQITCTYEKHVANVKAGTAWAQGIDIVKYKSQLEYIVAHTAGKVIKTVDYMDGTNKVADKEGMGYGNYVMILHNNKYQGKYVVTLYAHLEKVSVKENTNVTKGQSIAFMGNTGNSFGAHLHFEIRLYNNEPNLNRLHDTSLFEWIDPTPYIDKDLPVDAVATPKAVGYLDVATWDNGTSTLFVGGWAYKGGGNQNVTIKVFNGSKVVTSYTLTANKTRPDVKSVMKYSTDKVGFSDTKSLTLADGTYTVKAYVGTDQLTNSKTITVKKELTATSYPDYPEGSSKYYYVQKKFKDWSTSKGAFSVWKNAYNTYVANKASGYHIYDCDGKQLD